MAPFYGWGSRATRLQPLRGGSLFLPSSSQKSGTQFCVHSHLTIETHAYTCTHSHNTTLALLRKTESNGKKQRSGKNNKNYILYTEPLTLITQFHEISYFFIIFIPLFIFKKPQKAAEDVDLQRIGRINQFAQGSKRSSSR